MSAESVQHVAQGSEPIVSVLMPTFNQAAFICRAINSLLAQTLAAWELIIVDDGSTDATPELVAPYLADARISYERLHENKGLGAAINAGLARARAALIAYLPSDDLFFRDHLRDLVACLHEHTEAQLAYSGVQHHYNRMANGQIPGYPLQLVQVLHRRTKERWISRAELVTDDLERMFWVKLRAGGGFVGTDQVSCMWSDHPLQRHKVIREPLGGINPYRARYNVQQPLRFHSSVGNRIDEIERYRHYRERSMPPSADGLKIVLVGELAYNADRVLALAERGHTLYGLWTPDPYWYNAVGPLPFGHVEEIPRTGWQQALKRIQPDVVYALLNWQAVPWAHHVLHENPGVPFVWHFKEGPFICLEKGAWPQLIELHTRSDGQIFSSPEMRDWYATVVPGSVDPEHTLVLDGDLPKRDWFQAERTPRLSQEDGAIHTVVPGRPIGLHPHVMAELAAQNIHVHFYGDFTQGQWRDWIVKVRDLAPNHLHLHKNIDQEQWTAEFSQYDAGWLHFFKSENVGDLRRAIWDDLNYPARIATLAVAGLPMLQRDNSGAIVASQTLARERDLSVFFTGMEDLGAQLRDTALVERIRSSVWRQRESFTFDHHVDRLVAFFRRIIG